MFLASVFSISLFLSLELLLLLTSDPGTLPIRKQARCERSFIPRLPGGEASENAQSEALHSACTKVFNGSISHAPGNRTLEEVDGVKFPECEEEGAFAYKIGETVPHTPQIGQLWYGCDLRLCGAATWIPDTDNESTGVVYLSGPVGNGKTGMDLFITRILRNGERLKGQEQALANQLLKVLQRGGIDEAQIRQQVFTGVSNETCMFTTGETDVTKVQTWSIWTAGFVWGMSMLVAILGMCGRGKVFFDMGNAEHWAGRARHVEIEGGQDGGMGVQRGSDGVVWIVGMGGWEKPVLRKKSASESWMGKIGKRRGLSDMELEGDCTA